MLSREYSWYSPWPTPRPQETQTGTGLAMSEGATSPLAPGAGAGGVRGVAAAPLRPISLLCAMRVGSMRE